MERVADGGSAIRFIIGEYGSGKTFFLNLIRLIALEKGLVVMSADLAPDRRLHATGGQARGLYAEMARNLSTRTKPDGGALTSVVERFVSHAHQEAESKGTDTGTVIRDRLAHFEELTGGYDFSTVLHRYWDGHENGDDDLKSAALRWLRGEFSTKTDARKALGVRTIVDDASVYDHLKLMSEFVCAAGYKGLLVSLDEMVNLSDRPRAEANRKLLEEMIPDRVTPDLLHAVLRLLLAEQVSIRNLPLIIEAVAEAAPSSTNPAVITERVRARLANQICRALADGSGFVPVLTMSGAWEHEFGEAVKINGKERTFLMSPQRVQEFVLEARQEIQRHAARDEWPALMVAPEVRGYVRSMLERVSPMTQVISHNEVHRKAAMKTVGTIGA